MKNETQKKYIALICARGGSKGVPGKNIKELGGRPLIGWAISASLAIKEISRVIVSTDSKEIAAIALEEGAEVPFIRPRKLAEDTSPEWLAWQHAIEYIKSEEGSLPTGIVVIPPTAPLRKTTDIENCLRAYEKGDVDIVITVSEAHRNPYFNMVVNDKNGYSHLVIQPNKQIVRRQDVPVVYDMTTVTYVACPKFVLSSGGIFEGRVRSVVVPQERALDIDTIFDFKIAEQLIAYERGEAK